MEKINNKDQILKVLLENVLGTYGNNEPELIMEVLKSVNEPEFNGMASYYTRFGGSVENSFNSLSDEEKVKALNIVNKIVNGGTYILRYPENTILSKELSFIIDALASEYVSDSQESNLGWKPEEVNKQKIKDVLMIFYSPYSAETESGSKNSVSHKVSNQTPQFLKGKILSPSDISQDTLINAYVLAIQFLLDRRKYKAGNSFDFIFTQKAWPQYAAGLINKKDIETILPQIETDDEGGKTLGIEDIYGSEDKPVEIKKHTPIEKFKYILSKLDKEGQRIMKAWFKWYSQNFDVSTEDTAEKISDLVSSEDSLDILLPSEINSDSSKLFDVLAKEFGRDVNNESDYDYLKAILARTRGKMKELSKDPKVKDFLGIEDWSEKNLDVLKVTKPKGYEFKKLSKKEKEAFAQSSQPERYTAYDKYGRPIPVDKYGKIITPSKETKGLSEVMMESINEININFNYRFGKINKVLDKIKNFDNFMNEGYEVAVKDLDQDIYNYINNTVDGLDKAHYMLNELEIISNDIKFEFPEVSEKLRESVDPLVEELSKLIFKVKEVKKFMKPYLSESKLKKKDDDELDEERITNPESKEYIRKRENFIGSHIYGEDLGGLGKMYVAYSYGEQFPAYLWYEDKWYHNTDNYELEDGSVNEPTNQHKIDMRPVQDTHGLSTYALNNMIRKFKSKHKLGDNVHTDVEPGEKN